MSDKSPVYGDLDFVTTRISDQVRTIALGILAFVWLFIAGGDKAPVLPTTPSRDLLLTAAGLALLALLVDYAQYLFAYLNSQQALKRIEQRAAAVTPAAPTTTGQPATTAAVASGPVSVVTPPTFDYGALLFRARLWMFWGKQVSAIAAAVLLVAAVGLSLLC